MVEEMESRGQAFAAFGTRVVWLQRGRVESTELSGAYGVDTAAHRGDDFGKVTLPYKNLR